MSNHQQKVSCSSCRFLHMSVSKSGKFVINSVLFVLWLLVRHHSFDNLSVGIFYHFIGKMVDEIVLNVLITAFFRCSFILQPLSVQLHFFFFFSPPCCCRIRSLTASLNNYTTKRKRKGKQEGRGGRGRQTDKRPGVTTSKNRAGRTTKSQRRRQTGKRVHYRDERWTREQI